MLDKYQKTKRRKIIDFLTKVNPEKIVKAGEREILPAFRRAASRMPAYKKILSQHGLTKSSIKNLADFKKLPVLSKKMVFPVFDIEDLCVDGNLDQMQGVMTSSGFSGVYSFGINTKKNYESIKESIDMGLQCVFDADNKKTFFINSLPMGVKVRTSFLLAETSVRDDMVLALLKKISPKFEQTIILGDPHFIKKIIDLGNEVSIDWEGLGVNFILGEDWFSESFRSYLAQETGIDFEKPNGRLIGTTMGVAELDLNIFHESRETILVRRAAYKDKKLRQALFGKDEPIVPIIFHYYPHRTFVEALPENAKQQELVFSMMSKEMAVPLMRYNSGDRGRLFSHEEFSKILSDNGYASLVPKLKLPVVCVWGRNDRYLLIGKHRIYPELIKQGLYEDAEVARSLTGHFHLSSKSDRGLIEIQLRKGFGVNKRLKGLIAEAVSSVCPVELEVLVYEYGKYPHAMEIDYEKKFNNF